MDKKFVEVELYWGGKNINLDEYKELTEEYEFKENSLIIFLAETIALIEVCVEIKICLVSILVKPDYIKVVSINGKKLPKESDAFFMFDASTSRLKQVSTEEIQEEFKRQINKLVFV